MLADYSRQSNLTKPPAPRIFKTSGRTERFCGIGRRNRKKARALLKDVPLKGRTSPTMEKTHLCLGCTKLPIKGYYACLNCSLEFKKKSRTTALSIFFPGSGHFYARHPIIGLLEAVIGTIVFILFVTFTTTYFVSPPFRSAEHRFSPEPEGTLVASWCSR
jgi:hypothetical protein